MARKTAKKIAPKKSDNLEMVPVDPNQIGLVIPKMDSPVNDGFKVLSMAPIIKPSDIPINGGITGRLTGSISSPIKEYKSRMLNFTALNSETGEPDENRKFCFPATAAVASAFGLNDIDGDEEQGDALKEFIGCDVRIINRGKKKTRDSKKAPMNMLEVAIRTPEERAKALKK